MGCVPNAIKEKNIDSAGVRIAIKAPWVIVSDEHKKTVKRRWVILDHFFTTKLLVVENIQRRWGLICRDSQISACECTADLSPPRGFVGQTVHLEVSSKQIWYFNAFGLTIGTSLTSERVEVLDVNGCCIWF